MTNLTPFGGPVISGDELHAAGIRHRQPVRHLRQDPGPAHGFTVAHHEEMPVRLIDGHHRIDLRHREQRGDQQLLARLRVLDGIPPLPDCHVVLHHFLPDGIEQLVEPDLRIPPHPEHQRSGGVARQTPGAEEGRRQQAPRDQQHDEREGDQQTPANTDDPARRTLFGESLHAHYWKLTLRLAPERGKCQRERSNPGAEGCGRQCDYRLQCGSPAAAPSGHERKRVDDPIRPA